MGPAGPGTGVGGNTATAGKCYYGTIIYIDFDFKFTEKWYLSMKIIDIHQYTK
jgi:hypothetical protein